MVKERKYFDLLLEPNRIENLVEMAAMAKYMRFHGIGINITKILDNHKEKKIHEIESIIDNIAEEFEIEIIRMIEYNKNTKKTEKKLDPLKTLVFRNVKNEEEFRKTLKNKDIQTIVIPVEKAQDIIGLNTMNLLEQTDKVAALKLKPLWLQPPVELQKTLKGLNKITWILNKKYKFVVVSGAETKEEMRNPRSIRSYLRIIGIKDEKILEMISKLPEKIVIETKRAITIYED